MNQQIIDLAAKTTALMIPNTAEAIFRRIDIAKENHDKEKVILGLEGIIKDLINERNELEKIIQEYDELLGIQKISENDINYITENIIPIVSSLFESDLLNSDENMNKDEINKIIEVLKPLLSIETFTILQLLGFNFREAIGIPLTKLVSRSIDKRDQENLGYEYGISKNKKEKELYRFLQTEEGKGVYKELLKQEN